MRGSEESDPGAVAAEERARYGRRKRLRLGTPLKSMESLNPQGIDQRPADCSRRKRMTGTFDVTSVPEHDSRVRDDGGADRQLDSEASSSEKHVSVQGEEEGSSAHVSHGLISVIGRRRAMEDAFAVAELDSHHFFAVYDGHGGCGVANACRERLHRLVEEEMFEEWRLRSGGEEEEETEWERVMRASFSKMDREVGGAHREGDSETGEEDTTTGSTALVVLVGEEEIVVANCGDSRAVLCRGGAAVPLSHDHKPDRPDELERIEAAGGRVINWNGSRVLGVLATSRAIGDQYLKPYVIPEPDVTVCKRTESDAFIVIATDGLWDVVSNEFACEVVRRCVCGQMKRRFPEGLSGSAAAAAAAATVLAELAMARGSRDNITVIVVELKK